MSWIFQVAGSWILYTTFETLATTLKSPYHLSANFIVVYGNLRWLPSSHTLSPSLNGLYLVLSPFYSKQLADVL